MGILCSVGAVRTFAHDLARARDPYAGTLAFARDRELNVITLVD